MLPHLGDGRVPPQKGAFGLLSSPLLAIFKDMSLLKGYLKKLSHLHLISDLKKIVFNKSSRFPALSDHLCLPVRELRNKQKETESITSWPVVVVPSFRAGPQARLSTFPSRAVGPLPCRAAWPCCQCLLSQ